MGDRSVSGCALGKTCPSPTVLTTIKTGSPQGLAVSGATLYWGLRESDSASIASAPLTGGAATTLCKARGFIDTIDDLLIASGNLYFAAAESGIEVCALAATPGGKADAFFAKGSATGLATDGTDLYWTDSQDGGAIMKCALGTTCVSPTTLWSGVKAPGSIAVSDTQVYYTLGAAIGVFHK